MKVNPGVNILSLVIITVWMMGAMAFYKYVLNPLIILLPAENHWVGPLTSFLFVLIVVGTSMCIALNNTRRESDEQ